MRIVEVWDSRDQHDRWMEGTIQPAVQKVAAAGCSARFAGPAA